MNKSTKNRFQIVLATVALVAAFGTGARAADVAQVHVKYGDLNVNTPAGATVLYQRIRAAAAAVCGAPGERDLAVLAHAKACADKAIAEAVATVGNATLTEVYESKSGNVAIGRLASN
jgi:UrcA family protein